jgi:hypothetical protein
MILVIQIIIIGFSFFALSRIILRRKEKSIPLGEFIFWSVIWTSAAIIAAAPNIMKIAANKTGVENSINLFTTITIIIIFYLLFRLYVKVEKQQQDITKLVREMALKKKKEK